MHFSTLLASAGLVRLGIAGYTLSGSNNYDPNDFFNMFNFIAGPDSTTHGYTNYLNQGDAQNQGLINNNNGQVYIGVDYTNIAQDPGRKSIRLESKVTYSNGLIIIDLAHMPGGICGTWPAFWSAGNNWPNQGEIDIIEGVHNQNTNSMTLHTGAGCSVNQQPGGAQSNAVTTNCDVNAPGQPGNAGCGASAYSADTYGTAFNANGGGTYATEFTNQFIKIWFWRHGTEPDDVKNGNPNPGGWGVPTTTFQGACNFGLFQNQRLTFDTTFCGDWAGNVWGQYPACSSRASSCQAYVQNNPGDFRDAYWSVRSLKVYQNNGAMAKAAFVIPASEESGRTVETLTSTTASTLAPAAATPANPKAQRHMNRHLKRENY